MKIGFCYDFKDHYGFDPNNMDYTDFSTISTVNDIVSAFDMLDFDVELIGPIFELIKKIESGQMDCDLIFNITEGINSRNREGLLPALLEIYKIPFSGSDAYPLSLTLNKTHTKLIAEHLKIPTPKFAVFSSIDDTISAEQLEYPLVIKPNLEGGSMGVEKVNDVAELREKVALLLEKYHSEVLCEEYISGTEITVPIIGNGVDARVLGVAAAKYTDGRNIELFTSGLKYFGDIEYTTDFDCSKEALEKLEEYSLELFKFIGLNDYSRIDFRLSEDEIPYFLEINPLPALDKEDAFDICGISKGLKYHETINLIITEAIKRNHLESLLL